MKKTRSLILSLFVLFSLVACTAEGEAPGAYSGTFVLDGEHSYTSGVILEGALVMLDGRVALEQGARVAGTVFQLGGSLDTNGVVAGDIAQMGGELILGPDAVIEGDLRLGGGELHRSEGSTVLGSVLSGATSGFAPEDLFPERSLVNQLIWLLPESVLLASLAYLARRFTPRQSAHVKRAAVRYPVIAGAMGLLTGVVGLVLLVVMGYTLILIPVSLLALAAGLLAVWYGWACIGIALGDWLVGRERLNLSTAGSAFAGAFLFGLVVNLISLLPFAGPAAGLAAVAVSLGSVLLTRFGVREFVPEMEWAYTGPGGGPDL